MQETVGRQIAEELPREILHEYREIFSFFDRDGGGSIGAEELDQVMRTFGWDPKEEELKDMVGEQWTGLEHSSVQVCVIDQDGDGDIR